MNTETTRNIIDLCYGPPLSVIADCLRGFITAKDGYEIIACDFSAIEARVVAWLGGEDRVLEIFRTHGKIYEHAAAGIYRTRIDSVTKDQRQIGKVAVLALGFGGGKGAFQMMAKGYGVKVTDTEAEEIKINWRVANPNIVRYWYALEDAAKSSILNPNTVFSVNQTKYKTSGSFLWCKLPSNRVLCYPYPKIEPHETPWGEMKDTITYMAEDSLTRKWERTKTYGGSLCENVTQAVARDLLAESLVRLEERNFNPVMHVHDEIVCEIPLGWDNAIKEMEAVMSEVPAWAEGLPIEAKGWRGRRFRK